MNAELIVGGVGYWYGFSLIAAMHFFVREFKQLESTLALRLWRLALSLLILAGVFTYVFFSAYVIGSFSQSDVHFKGLFLGSGVYICSAWLWMRYVKRPA